MEGQPPAGMLSVHQQQAAMVPTAEMRAQAEADQQARRERARQAREEEAAHKAETAALAAQRKRAAR